MQAPNQDVDVCPCKGDGTYIAGDELHECPHHFADLDATWLTRGSDLPEQKPAFGAHHDSLFLWCCIVYVMVGWFISAMLTVLERTGAM